MSSVLDAPDHGNTAEPERETGPEPPIARLLPILSASVRTGWDRIGLLISASVSWSLVASIPLGADRWIPIHGNPWIHAGPLALTPLVAALPTAGLYSLAYRIAAHEEAFYPHFWTDGLKLIGPALRLAMIQTATAGLILLAGVFYSRVPYWPARIGLVITGYAALIAIMMGLYQWPALIAQERGAFDDPGRRAARGAFGAVRRSFYLALARPTFSLGLAAVLAAGTAAMFITVVLPALLWSGAAALTTTLATRALLVQFRILPAPPIIAPIADHEFHILDAKSVRGGVSAKTADDRTPLHTEQGT